MRKKHAADHMLEVKIVNESTAMADASHGAVQTLRRESRLGYRNEGACRNLSPFKLHFPGGNI